jgi:anthranilate synthase/aminodeoxychorismate synthase-like glutamine amidotransferase
LILLIDNYDSFVYNLARYFQRLGHVTQIVRNDAVDAHQVELACPNAVVLSPGPCTPREAGCSLDVVRSLAGKIPMLGVCLGHQAIVEALGGRVIRAPEPVHGRASVIRHDGRGVFLGLPNPLTVGRYHSLVVDRDTLPDSLEVTAKTTDGVIMAVRHRQYPLVGLQFHPESILTQCGFGILSGFLRTMGLTVPSDVPDISSEWSGQAHQPVCLPNWTGISF